MIRPKFRFSMFWRNKERGVETTYLGTGFEFSKNFDGLLEILRLTEERFEGLRLAHNSLNEKVNAILDHMGLEWEPERTKTEPAKLREKLVLGEVISWHRHEPTEPKKKKRGRPKGSKNKKK